MNLMKKRKITTIDLANKLNISTSQIYQWNKKGIPATNPHYKQLKELIPELQPRAETLKTNGQKDGRYKSGRKPKQLHLTETTLPDYKEPEFKSTVFPKIIYKKQHTIKTT